MEFEDVASGDVLDGGVDSRLERAFRQAGVDGDITALQRLLESDAVLVPTNAAVLLREAVLGACESGHVQVLEYIVARPVLPDASLKTAFHFRYFVVDGLAQR